MHWCINRNARPNNNQLITYYLRVRYLLGIQQYSVNTTYPTYNTWYEDPNCTLVSDKYFH